MSFQCIPESGNLQTITNRRHWQKDNSFRCFLLISFSRLGPHDQGNRLVFRRQASSPILESVRRQVCVSSLTTKYTFVEEIITELRLS